jgi:hypothetical protein
VDGQAVRVVETFADAVDRGFKNHPVAATLRERDQLGVNVMPTAYPIMTAINASAGTGPRPRAVFETTEKRTLMKLDRIRAAADKGADEE